MTVGIIGYGRFGRLWAELVAPHADVLVYDAASVSSADVSVTTQLAEVCARDVLFLCVPMSTLEDVCLTIVGEVGEGTVVVDVASVKVKPREWMQAAFQSSQKLVFTHPLFGPDSVARSGIVGKKIVLCTESDAEGLSVVKKLSMQIGLEILETTTDDHDKQMARSQALVHFIGRGLAPLGLTEQEIATPDYERLLAMTELVNHDSSELFEDMQRLNPYTAEVRSELLSTLAEIDDSL